MSNQVPIVIGLPQIIKTEVNEDTVTGTKWANWLGATTQPCCIRESVQNSVSGLI